MLSRHSRLTVLAALAVAPAFVAGCSSPASGGGHAENSGTATFALTQVPTGVACVEIDVVGGVNVTQRFPVRAGESSVLTMGGLPLGNVDVIGSAFDMPCQNTPGANASWVSQSVSATIVQGTPTSVTLELFRNGKSSVGVDFNDTAFRDVTTFAGKALQRGNVDGVGAAARFTRPQQLVFGGGNLYVADARANVIRSIAVADATVKTIAGNPAAPAGSADGVGAAATFDAPIGVAYDQASQSLFVTDTGSCTIRKIVLATAAVSTFAGAPGACTDADGAGVAASFDHPYGILADGTGNLYVTDSGAGTIRKIVIATAAVTTFAGVAGQTGAIDGPVATARFQGPAGLTTDGGNLYVLDGATVRQVVIGTARVFTIAGDASTQGAADGYGGRFSTPEGIAFDGKSTLFITDFTNSDVRSLALDTGLVSTVAGSVGSLGFADGHGPAAQLHFPIGVAVDPAGHVYVSDAGNATIRKM